MKLGGGCVKGLMGSRGVDIIIFHFIHAWNSQRIDFKIEKNQRKVIQI